MQPLTLLLLMMVLLPHGNGVAAGDPDGAG